MWPFQTNRQILTSLFEPKQLHISLITTTKNSFILDAHTSLALDSCAYAHGALFTLNTIQKQIQSFLMQYKVTHPFATFGLGKHVVAEHLHIVDSGTFEASPIKGYVVNTQYLYPTNTAQFCYMVTSIAYAHLFQYRLLAQLLSLNLIGIFPSNLARLFIYKKIKGNSFRQSQLAQEMHQCNNHIEQLTIFNLSSLIEVPTESTIEPSTLAATAGLVAMHL